MSRAQKPASLRLPLRELLIDPPLSDARAALATVRARGRRKRAGARAVRYGLGLATALLLIAFVPRLPWAGVQLPAQSPPAALRLATEADLPRSFHADAHHQAFPLSDGSRLTLAAGAELEVLESSPRALRFALRKGRARFDVRPHGPRTWIVECGAVTVEVVGTSFVIDRGEDATRVEVMRGAVLVRGSEVPDGVQRLAAGQSLAVRPVRAGTAAVTIPAAPPAAAELTVETVKPKPTTPWRGPARRGDWQNAWKTLREHGFEQAVKAEPDVEELLLLADIARMSGHARSALIPLERVTRLHAEDARAALAAFTMGTLRLDALDEPAVAAGDVARALDLGLPRALQQDARARLVEAHARAGDPARARAAAADYRARFPAGSRRAQVDTWSPPP